MNKFFPFLISACLGMAAFTPLAQAEGVYRWEENGKLMYSDQPKAGAKIEQVDKYGHVKKPTSDASKQDESADKTSAVRSQECDKARARMVEYQNSPTLSQRNLKGEVRNLSASERIDIIVRAQTDVNDLCGEPQASTPESQNPGNFTADVDINEDSNAELP